MAKIVGTNGRDFLVGTKGKDVIIGKGGNDKIYGKGGNDVIKGGGGNDVIKGQGGNDILKGGGGNDFLRGGKGKDVLKGQSDHDFLFGGPGRDKLIGNKGADFLVGDKGADVFRFNNKDGFFNNVLPNDFDDHVMDYEDGVDKFDIPGSPADSLIGVANWWLPWSGLGDGAVVVYATPGKPASYFWVKDYPGGTTDWDDFI